MKCIISIAILATAVLAVQGDDANKPSQVYQDKMRPLAEKCKEETKASDEDVNAIVNREELKTQEAKCLQKCVYISIGAIKNGQTVDYDEALKIYQTLWEGDKNKLDNATTAVKDCTKVGKDNSSDDLCELAAKVQECFRKY